jgi:hypothetical protein
MASGSAEDVDELAVDHIHGLVPRSSEVFAEWFWLTHLPVLD